ncbi:MAG: DUF1214 domain-containing protein [Pseudomonadales bacterium]
MSIETKSRSSLKKLIGLLQEIDERWCSEEWNLNSAEDIVGSHRALMHILEASIVGYFEKDERTPDFRRIVTPSRKLTGDNSDAIYYDAPVSPEHVYQIDGEMNGSVYFSMTIENDAESDKITTTGGALNDTDIDIDADGKFTITLGGPAQDRNWLPLGDGASRVTTRHYFEHATPAALEPSLEPRMKIRCTSEFEQPAPPNDDSVSGGIDRVCNILRSRTLNMPTLAGGELPSFMSLNPNNFPEPQTPGDFGLAAVDAHYSMAPFFIGPDEALVITGRWPTCRFANVCLWNRFQQTLDYSTRPVSLNRTQAVLEDDGSFKMIIAHENPGLPNWLDTEGNLFGLVFWRFFLVEGEAETPQATVVKLADLSN